jgi:hypothetical protein
MSTVTVEHHSSLGAGRSMRMVSFRGAFNMSQTNALVEPAAPSEPQLKPPAERFWKKYSPHYEFPISTVATVAVHVAAIALIIYVVTTLLQQQETVPPVPITGRELSLDNPGDGGEAGGGRGKDEANDERPREPQPQIPEVTLDKNKIDAAEWLDLKDDPDAVKAIAKRPDFQRLNALNEEMKKAIARSFKPTGNGNGAGTGPDSDKAGKGGANTSGRRSVRWTIIFDTNDGRKYLRQLTTFKATILIPEPPDWKKNRVFEDLTKPNPGRPQGNDVLPTLYFVPVLSDPGSGVPSVLSARVAGALGLDYVPPYFMVFFPKAVEDEMAAKETGCRNLREDDIEETKFHVIERNGGCEIEVIDQKPKWK